jgi:hypothetical protein
MPISRCLGFKAKFFKSRSRLLAAGCFSLGLISCVFQTAVIDAPQPEGDGNFHAVGEREFSSPLAHSLDLVITSDGNPVVGFTDGSQWGRATVMHYDPASKKWKNLGDSPLSQGMAGKLALTMTPKGTLYAAFNDLADSNRVTVKKWVSHLNQWVMVGEQGITPPETMQLDLASSPDGQLFLAYKDDTHFLRATVLRYDEAKAEWVMVGPPGFTDAEVNFLTLAVDPSGKPYIGYYDEELGGKPTVMRYKPEAGTWEIAGERGFTSDMTAGNVIATDRQGRPYLAFTDRNDFTFKLTVMTLDSSENWQPVGGAGFSPGQASWPSLAFNAQDRPYVAFSDEERGGSVRVMRLLPTGDAWETVGKDSLSHGISFSMSLAFAADDDLWVAFTEGDDSRITVLKYGSSQID